MTGSQPGSFLPSGTVTATSGSPEEKSREYNSLKKIKLGGKKDLPLRIVLVNIHAICIKLKVKEKFWRGSDVRKGEKA